MNQSTLIAIASAVGCVLTALVTGICGHLSQKQQSRLLITLEGFKQRVELIKVLHGKVGLTIMVPRN